MKANKKYMEDDWDDVDIYICGKKVDGIVAAKYDKKSPEV